MNKPSSENNSKKNYNSKKKELISIKNYDENDSENNDINNNDNLDNSDNDDLSPKSENNIDEEVENFKLYLKNKNNMKTSKINNTNLITENKKNKSKENDLYSNENKKNDIDFKKNLKDVNYNLNQKLKNMEKKIDDMISMVEKTMFTWTTVFKEVREDAKKNDARLTQIERDLKFLRSKKIMNVENNDINNTTSNINYNQNNNQNNLINQKASNLSSLVVSKGTERINNAKPSMSFQGNIVNETSNIKKNNSNSYLLSLTNFNDNKIIDNELENENDLSPVIFNRTNSYIQ
jgi:hypothetical protein